MEKKICFMSKLRIKEQILKNDGIIYCADKRQIKNHFAVLLQNLRFCALRKPDIIAAVINCIKIFIDRLNRGTYGQPAIQRRGRRRSCKLNGAGIPFFIFHPNPVIDFICILFPLYMNNKCTIFPLLTRAQWKEESIPFLEFFYGNTYQIYSKNNEYSGSCFSEIQIIISVNINGNQCCQERL